MEAGLLCQMVRSKARFSSLDTSAGEGMEVNQTLGSLGLNFSSPLATASMRSRILSSGKTPMVMDLAGGGGAELFFMQMTF